MVKVIIIGNVGRDPEMRYLPNGNAVVNFSVASNNRYKKDGVQETETEWFNVSAFGQLADRCNQMVRKGSQVYLEGRLSSSTFVGKNGKNGHSMNVALSDFHMVGANAENKDQEYEQDDDDLPI